MTISQRMHAQVALVVLIVVGLAVVAWILVPAKATTWMISIATMAGIWLVVSAIGWARPFAQQSAAERKYLAASVIAGGVILAAALGKKLAIALGVDGGLITDRALGIAMGVILVLLGNTLPKVLSPLTANRCAPSQMHSMQRFAGWIFVTAGLASIALWIVAPAQALSWSMIMTAGALALVLLRYAWAYLAPRQRSTPVRD